MMGAPKPEGARREKEEDFEEKHYIYNVACGCELGNTFFEVSESWSNVNVNFLLKEMQPSKLGCHK